MPDIESSGSGIIGVGSRRDDDADAGSDMSGATRALSGSSRVGSAGSGMIGVGVDLVDVDRFRSMLRRRPSAADRMFTAAERAYAARAADPSMRLAARFAAKEAALKALGLGLGGMRMAEIEVVRLEGGMPELVLHADAASTAADRGVGRWLVTLSHTDRLAQAVVVALAA